MKIATLIMVKNEEDVICNSLNSIKNYSDLVILLDTGSTDDTIQVIKNYCTENRIKNFLENINENPLGSAALAGTSYNIDRHFTSKKLGFQKNLNFLQVVEFPYDKIYSLMCNQLAMKYKASLVFFLG